MARGVVLLVGPDERFTATFAKLVPGATVRHAHEAVDTEGIGVDLVVIAGSHPLSELDQVRVHPNLFDKPVVVIAPGRRVPNEVWHDPSVWPLTSVGPQLREELVTRVDWLLPRTRHPAFQASIERSGITPVAAAS